jgi:hypothetical protein
MIASGKWIQKAVWNRWVTTREREQPHKTPVTSTWTEDFLTREGEGRKAVGDWLRDKTISLKARRRLLQTNADVFPCEGGKWDKHPDGICELCKRCREMVLTLLDGRPDRGILGIWAPLGICRAVCDSSKLQRQQGSQRLISTGTR